MEVVDAAASIVGGVVGGVLAIALLSACYVAHARAKRREMIKVRLNEHYVRLNENYYTV